MARLAQADLVDLNRQFEERTPAELLLWTAQTFGPRVAILSAMQQAGSVVCHMAHAAKLPMKVVFVDTGVSFPETLATRDRIAREYGLEVVTLEPELTMEEQTEKYGVLYLSVEGQKQCCHMRKIEPLYKIKGQFDAFIGSLRRAEGGRREGCPVLAVDPEMNSLRINVLAMLTNEQMEAYLKQHDVIVNPLHAQGYATISCNRCTTPVLPNEPHRAGRWRHLGPWSVYCSINPTDRDPTTSPAIELPLETVDKILGRKTDFMI